MTDGLGTSQHPHTYSNMHTVPQFPGSLKPRDDFAHKVSKVKNLLWETSPLTQPRGELSRIGLSHKIRIKIEINQSNAVCVDLLCLDLKSARNWPLQKNTLRRLRNVATTKLRSCFFRAPETPKNMLVVAFFLASSIEVTTLPTAFNEDQSQRLRRTTPNASEHQALASVLTAPSWSNAKKECERCAAAHEVKSRKLSRKGSL